MITYLNIAKVRCQVAGWHVVNTDLDGGGLLRKISSLHMHFREIEDTLVKAPRLGVSHPKFLRVRVIRDKYPWGEFVSSL